MLEGVGADSVASPELSAAFAVVDDDAVEDEFDSVAVDACCKVGQEKKTKLLCFLESILRRTKLLGPTQNIVIVPACPVIGTR